MKVWRGLAAFLFVVAGTNHFLHPRPYLAMMPPSFPEPELLIQISGAAEILGGLGLLVPRLRVAAGCGLLALLVAVFPANLEVALHGWPGVNLPRWVLWARLPFQLLFGWGVFRVALAR